MKHLSFLRRHANIVFCLLLCLVYQRAESKELFENNSLDTCYVLAIANVDLTTDLQKCEFFRFYLYLAMSCYDLRLF